MKIAVIPARGGSKRIPRKNIRNFCGKPIIVYSIKKALESQLFDRVIVSTDDEEIAEVAETNGAEIPFLRPPNISDDYTGTNTVTKHAIEWFQKNGSKVTHACCIYATAPFVRISDLKDGYQRLLESDKLFAFSVTSYSFPIQRAITINTDGDIRPFWPEYTNTRSQDLIEAYHDAGQFYWGTTEAFLSEATIFSPASIPIRMPRYLVQDIDTLEDWDKAELMYKLLKEELAKNMCKKMVG